LSEGIVSGIRAGDGYKYFQISAPISHGSSGGPIFNSKGEVIGIAVATIEEGQNLNFAVPIDYARGMVLDMGAAKPLSAIYEPEPQPEKPAENPVSAAAPSASLAEAKSVIPEEMKKSSYWYIEAKLFSWTKKDADAQLGDAVRSRHAFDQNQNIVGEIFGYDDPTKLVKLIELSFDSKTQKLTAIYAYPWDMTWAQGKAVWGDKETTTKNADGSRFHNYKDRNLHVLVGKDEKIINFGSW
jgi:trypsin-like peptidase